MVDVMFERLPAVCSECGIVFASSIVGFDESETMLTVLGGIEDSCPQCGGLAQIPSGVFRNAVSAWESALLQLAEVLNAVPNEVIELLRLHWNDVLNLRATISRLNQIASDLKGYQLTVSATGLAQGTSTALAVSAPVSLEEIDRIVDQKIRRSNKLGRQDVYEIVKIVVPILLWLLSQSSPSSQHVGNNQHAAGQLVPNTRTCAVYVDEHNSNSNQSYPPGDPRAQEKHEEQSNRVNMNKTTSGN